MTDQQPIPRHEPTIPEAWSLIGRWKVMEFLLAHCEPIEDEL
jgi:hypothetical protein